MIRGQKLILTVLIILFCANFCYADTTSELVNGIEFYKNGKYSECITKLSQLVKTDPTLVLGYYYLGLAYSKTGKEDLAEINYSKVVNLGSDKTLTSLAKEAKKSINAKKVVVEVEDTADNKSETTEEEYNPILSDGVVSTETSQEKEPVSKSQKQKEVKPVQKQAKFEFDGSREPTNDEIVNAIKILQKAGILKNDAAALSGNSQPQQPQQGYPNQYQQQNPYQQNPYMDPRTQQMNSMLMMMNNGNNNNGMMNMMPYMQNGGKIDPQLMQMMLMQQMMPNFSGGNNNGGY